MSDEKTMQQNQLKEELSKLDLLQIVSKKSSIVKDIKEKLIPQLAVVEKKSERQKIKKTLEKIQSSLETLIILDELQDSKDQ